MSDIDPRSIVVFFLGSFGIVCLLVSRAKEMPNITYLPIQFYGGRFDGRFWQGDRPYRGDVCRIRCEITQRCYLYTAVERDGVTRWEFDGEDVWFQAQVEFYEVAA